MEIDSDEDDCIFGKLFDNDQLEVNRKEITNHETSTIRDLIALPFSHYFYPNNPLAYSPSWHKRKNISTLAKFKEINVKKIKEDMLYYCTPVDILAKIENKNSEYLINESAKDFVNDLGIDSFLENECIIADNLKKNMQVGSKIIQDKNLENWKEFIQNKKKDDENFKEMINKTNGILQLIQNTMEMFITKNIDKDKLDEKLNQLISEAKIKEINLDNIGFEMNMILENNLLYLFGLISKFYGKEDKMMATFVEKFIEIFNIIKSNRLFFALVQYLTKNKNLLEYIKIQNPIESLSGSFINLENIIIKSIKSNCEENLLILPNLSYNLNSKEENDENKKESDNNFWAVNNMEELCIFSLSKNNPKSKLFFYRINLRIEEEEIENVDDIKQEDGSFRFLDFGELDLTNNDHDEISDINISIKDDLIYICYFINQKLKEVDEFVFAFKIYTTSMLLIKEEIIKNDNFKYQKSFLYSDKNNIYVITDENKIFSMKKEYSMNTFAINDLSIKCENKNISLVNYKFYNCFNLENLLILENKNDTNDLLLVQIYKENEHYIFNLFESKQNIEQDKFRYKFCYNDSIFLFIKKNDNKLYFYLNLFFSNYYADGGFQFLPFETNLNQEIINIDKKIDAFKILIKEYAYCLNLYGNFDMAEEDKNLLNKYPFSFCFNINENNLNFIIEQILNSKDQENIYYYIIILKQYICSLYNANLFDIKLIEKIITYMKDFILNIKKNRENKYNLKILKEIIHISSYLNDVNIVEISDVEEILKVTNDDKDNDLKINFYLLDLLFSQPKTQINHEVFDIACEVDKNFLLQIFSKINDSKRENRIISSFFKLHKNVMTKAMAVVNYYYQRNKNDKSLFKKINEISSNIIEISKSYKNIYNTKIGKLSFLLSSINFSFFYLIIQRRLDVQYDFEDFAKLYKVLLSLDQLNINENIKKSQDIMNSIRITNSKIEGVQKEQSSNINIINFKTNQNITFKSNFINYVGCISLKSYFEKIVLIRKNMKGEEIQNELDIDHCIDQIFYDVWGIKIYLKENLKYKWQLILDIIPIKDVTEFLELKNNENHLIINSIQKTLLYYFLFLLKNNVNTKINDFLKNNKIKNFFKLYHNEFLKFIYTNDIKLDMNLLDNNKEITTNSKGEKKEEKSENIMIEINNLISDLKKAFNLHKIQEEKDGNKGINNINLLIEFLNQFISFFGNFNQNKSNNMSKLENYYDKSDITINQIQSYKDINFEDKLYEKLFEQFEKDILKKNRMLGSIKSNDQVKKMILKIFQIIIKYYNYNSKFLDLIDEMSNFSTQNEDYNLFLDIYEQCYQMKLVYNQEKSRFIDEKFEEQAENYFKTTNDKLNFIYKIIIPSFNENLKYDKTIVQNLIELIKNNDFDPKVVLKYSEIQNIHCTLKVIELLIINNLLLNLTDEENIKFVLCIINDLFNKNIENNKYSISISLLDSIYGADYSKMQQVKNQFHLLIGIIVEKYCNNQTINSKLGIITKILLYQSLLWKYKGRDFNIMPNILSCFEELKSGKNFNDKTIFELKHENIFRINKYDLESLNDIKFEIFKIISSQIFLKIKDNLENNNIIKEKNLELNLMRTISKISNFESIINLMMSYFLEIQESNKHYHDLILFFYKNVVNSIKLIDSMSFEIFTKFIIKIFTIIFDDNSSSKKSNTNIKRNNNTKFIILKLFLQILENTDNEEKISTLSECCTEYDKNALNDKDNTLSEEELNPFKYLLNKFYLLLQKEKCSFLKFYYLKIFLFCLSKVDNSEIKKKNELLDLNFLLSMNENINQFETRFSYKFQYDNKFEDISLFSNTQNLKLGKLGTLLCYMEDKNSFDEYIKNSENQYFDYDELVYNLQQTNNDENIYAIMDEALDGKNISKINNLEKKNLNSIVMISNKNNNSFYNKYLEKNASDIYDKLISKLIENKLNYKGINYILKMIYTLLDHITIDNAEKIIKYIFTYINDKDVGKNKNEWDLCSYEYFENEMNSFKNIFFSFDFDINKELKITETEKEEKKDKDKLYEKAPLLLSSLFNYSINSKDFYLEYKNNNNINSIFLNELKLINNKITSEEVIKATNLSFYKSNEDNSSTLISDDSILLIKKINPDKELLDILSKNKLKIKSIITSEIDSSNKEEYDQFISQIDICVFSSSITFYKKLEEFFIKGKGGIYISTDKKSTRNESDIISIYYPNHYLKYKQLSEEKSNNINNNKFYLEEDLGLDMLFIEDILDKKEEQKLADKKQKELLLEYEENIQKKYEEIKFDINKIFCLQNINLCYRILYEIFKKENIMNKLNKDLLVKNMDKILEIFDFLCKEYYFNINENFPMLELQNLLKNSLKSLCKLDISGKKMCEYFIKSIYKYLESLHDDDSKKEKQEAILLDKCKQYDKILFILKNCNDSFSQNLDNFYFELITIIMKDMILENKKIRNKMIEQDFITYFLNELMDSIYDIITNNKPNSKLFIRNFINNENFINTMITFINEIIDIKKYFNKDSHTIPKSKTLLVQFGFKYLDICFYIFFKEKQYDLIKYWLKSNNDFFYFFSSYKILATEKHYEEIDYKELLSVIAYISDSISCFNKNEENKINSQKKVVQMKNNEFNKVELNFKNDSKKYINLTSFSLDNKEQEKGNNNKFSKLAIFTYNKKLDKYNLQDIIDTSNYNSTNLLIEYKQLFNTDNIYLVPLNELSTSLYAFGSNFNHSLGINGKLAKFYDIPTKCQGLPNDVWNIGYGNNYCLALSEKNNKIYACGCNKGGGFNSTPRASFNDETRINKNKDSDITNKYIGFATGNCDSTLLMNEKGELYGIGNNEEKIFGLEDDSQIKYPKKLNLKIFDDKENENLDEEEKKMNDKNMIGKIKKFYIGYKNSYIIDDKGKLYGIGNNEFYQISSEQSKIIFNKWKNIELPENCTRFVDVAVGENYIICLIEDKEGNNKLYSRGDLKQRSISGEEKNIRYLTMCDNTKNLNFKKIYSRNNVFAAITIDGDLYILKDQNFSLVSFNDKNNTENKKDSNEKIDNQINEINEEQTIVDKEVIVDDVAISKSHVLAIARKYDKEKGTYIKKLYGLGDNSRGALGLPINSNKEDNNITSITEIPLIDENKKNLIPIKLTIGDNKSFVLCVNEEELIKSIKEKKEKEKDLTCSINVENISIEKMEANILDFYYSKNVELFINIFRSITSKAMSNFIEAIDEIKMSNPEIIEKNGNFSIEFPIFYDYLTKHQEITELSHIFIQTSKPKEDLTLKIGNKPELKSIFNYLKSKADYITTDLFKYCATNEKSEYKQFLQKAIGNNLLYLNAQSRLEKFNELLSKLHFNSGREKRIDIDRFKANIFYDKYNENPKNKIPDIDLNQTIFGQIYQQAKKMKAEEFLISKNKRLFIVCLKNEYATDSGGPYHEVISGMCQELQNDYLNMFIKTPNNKNDVGLLRDKYIPNPDAKREIYEGAYEFLGKLMACSLTSGEVLELNFHPVVWKALLGNEITFYEYETIDSIFFSLINNLESELKTNTKEDENNISTSTEKPAIKLEDKEKFNEKYGLNFVIKSSNESDIMLKPEGDKIQVSLDNLKEYITLSKKMRTSEFSSQIECMKKGFNSVIPSSICQHLYWRQLEEMICGKTTLDIRSFKENTEYDGFQKDSDVIKWFWDWLSKCNDHEQSLYLKFVSGRTRLPKDKNFKYTHVIVKNNYHGNESFPNSATCFFTLKLPVYKDRETLEKRMNYAIQNCDEIDADN